MPLRTIYIYATQGFLVADKPAAHADLLGSVPFSLSKRHALLPLSLHIADMSTCRRLLLASCAMLGMLVTQAAADWSSASKVSVCACMYVRRGSGAGAT